MNSNFVLIIYVVINCVLQHLYGTVSFTALLFWVIISKLTQILRLHLLVGSREGIADSVTSIIQYILDTHLSLRNNEYCILGGKVYDYEVVGVVLR